MSPSFDPNSKSANRSDIAVHRSFAASNEPCDGQLIARQCDLK